MKVSANRNPLIILTGMHAAGKSSAKRLLSRIGYLTHDEIGWALRQKMFKINKDTQILTSDALEWFDSLIVKIELIRDEFINSIPHLPHCIETWHIGNLAYAAKRSPALVPNLENIFVSQCLKMHPLFIVLTISREVFLERCSLNDMCKNDLHDFYLSINETILHYLEKYSLDYYMVTNNSGLDTFEKEIEMIVRNEDFT